MIRWIWIYLHRQCALMCQRKCECPLYFEVIRGDFSWDWFDYMFNIWYLGLECLLFRFVFKCKKQQSNLHKLSQQQSIFVWTFFDKVKVEDDNWNFANKKSWNQILVELWSLKKPLVLSLFLKDLTSSPQVYSQFTFAHDHMYNQHIKYQWFWFIIFMSRFIVKYDWIGRDIRSNRVFENSCKWLDQHSNEKITQRQWFIEPYYF